MASSDFKPEGFTLEKGLIRKNILGLQPYRCARDDFSTGILLDANENALGPSLSSSSPPSSNNQPNGGSSLSSNGTTAIEDALQVEDYAALELNRYPDPVQGDIKDRFSDYRGFRYGRKGVFLGVGSDEIIDLLIRVTCTPGQELGDKLLVCPPTYGMYSVCAAVNDVEVIKCPLDTTPGPSQFQPRIDAISEILSGPEASRIKLLFLTSPGNPTGTSIPNETIRQILEHPAWRGLVVVDEAYIDFSKVPSAVKLFDEGWQNLVVMQTLSKGFGLAGIRMGISFQSQALAQILANTKAPYTIGTPTAALTMKALSPANLRGMEEKTRHLKVNRAWLLDTLARDFAASIGPPQGANDANFVLVPVYGKAGGKQVDNARAVLIYKKLAEEKGVVVRYRGNEVGCEACLRITIGTDDECRAAIEKLREVLTEV